ncbi:MAG: hypothetical protein LV480_13245 [Methylacidiphilales bacterium]|nr:hypothetical protein [Candidatus Methylacidiphilales bacterium]
MQNNHKTGFFKIARKSPLVLAWVLIGLGLPTHNTRAQSQPTAGQKTPADDLTPNTATSTDTQTEELAKKAQNPVADLISVPLQSNFNFNTGPSNATVDVFNLQPVIPFHITKDWNLITRTILPIVNQPSVAPGYPSAFGLGDLNPTFFFSPSKPSKFIWGFGPTFTLPTGTDAILTSGKWSAGPAAVFLTVQGPVVAGVLINNQWSFAGWGDKNVNQMLMQPFFNYNLPEGWYLTTSPIMTSNWEADSNDRWTVPIGGGFGRLFRIDKQPINASLQAFDNVLHPHGTSDWSLRFQVQLLFPTK